MRVGFTLALLVTLTPFSSFCQGSSATIPAGLIHLPKGGYFPTSAFVVDKKTRTLTIWEQSEHGLVKVREYASDFGKNLGDKLATGDFKTPEGIYFLQTMLEGESLPFSKYGQRAFTTDYPNLFDRREKKTGNGIWLHAIPDSESLERGSRGCVVVRNKSIMDLSPFVHLKQTALLVFNEVTLEDAVQVKSRANEIQRMIEAWRTAWVTKDIENYIRHYSDSFETMKMTREKWRTYKSGLNAKYSTIGVQFSAPVILQHKDQIIVRMLQKYKSDLHEDFGEKTLYLKATHDHLGIVAEHWEEQEATPAAVSELLNSPAASAQFSQLQK